MAYLLGSEMLMESLRTDVQDIQWAVCDIFSRTGPVRQLSWKFPDKVSCDLNIEELLELYSHGEDEEERQVAHIALYELVIDRLVLLIQSLSCFTEKSLCSTKSGKEVNDPSSGSIGLIVKRYWEKQVQLQTVLQQTMSENKSKSKRLSDLESNNIKMEEEINHHRWCGVNSTSPGLGGKIPPNNAELILGRSMLHVKTPDISNDCYSKSSQTVETAFVPCESCAAVQKSFHQTGDVIVSICQAQKLPSSLQKFRVQIDCLDWLSSNDIARWAAEQNKDISRIHKHFENVSSTIEPLKTEITVSEKRCKQFEKRTSELEKELKLEKDAQSAVQRQCLMKVTDIESKCAENVAIVKRQKDELSTNKDELQKEVENYKAELTKQQINLKDLVSEKKKLETELLESTTNNAEIAKLKAICDEYKTKLEGVNDKLTSSGKEICKEQTRYKSAVKHSQNLQAKQDSLIQRMDTLDQENECLKNQVAELEDEKEVIEESLKKTTVEVTSLHDELKNKEVQMQELVTEKQKLEKSIDELEQTIQDLETNLEEAKEQEKLLVAYPDLHGPVNPDVQGIGDILLDMESQVKANFRRIQLLEEQNSGLRHSITKVLELEKSYTKPAQPAPAPVTLWNQGDLDKLRQEVRSSDTRHDERLTHTAYSKMKNNSGVNDRPPSTKPNYERGMTFSTAKTAVQNPEDFIVSKPLRADSGSQRRASPGQNKRPPSGKAAMVAANSTSIGAYIQMKKSPPTPSDYKDSRPHTGKMKPDSARSRDTYEKEETYICPRCDKMYTRARDLEIHKSYCSR
ncbi:hypothetical protein ScPMuIL_005698 [Solemya velum]